MIQNTQIERIAKEVASANLSPQVVQRVISVPIVDSQGSDALRITIVIAPNSVDRISGDAALDTLAQIQSGLENAGEGRFAVVDYATEAELADVGD
jgi:hypothetical protein